MAGVFVVKVFVASETFTLPPPRNEELPTNSN